jgi:hypothetical protein
MAATRFSVYPRYAPGSPADVNQALAERVLAEEAEFYEVALSGRWGEEHQIRANRLGLGGIVEQLTERRGKLEIRDLLTGDVSTRTLSDRHAEINARREENRKPWIATYRQACP